ncbi:MAG: hypothetical protein IT359_06795 [Gemmatimonadaceae bacterium]|nr:hypothetical protein [Gemmatimonadaceae bacterium]
MTARRGVGKLGCLFSLLIAVTVVYFGVNIGEVYWRYYQFRDAMQQEVRFARSRSDDDIVRHLRALVDSIGLPDEAGRVRVQRSQRSISIFSEYSEHVELPLFVREFRFRPQADGGL